ncbi:MAG: hypothetical protein AVDCRST_MAG19-2477 [uncultured Thermomicrobiales bacterium]|uniref:NADPH-dependent FMN reductase-like domain-containing protein n=1 Tax=uncultured Thermomicrobiales bacterium TaxID=1645740 RepID=A0A6J4V4V4_9BACT|nr:MAG: hypothetical protein AVDCRST_MAG19-2477 [uncultured Thermomicrobiales bacterium]
MQNNHDTFSILAIPGSLRRGSLNRRLLEAARGVAPDGVDVQIVDLRPIPFYDGDVEAAGDPPAVRELKAWIRTADALLVATPEYNGTVPGVLQNAIDWASRPRGAAALDAKPVAVLGASPGGGGTARAQPLLRRVLANAGADVLAEPVVTVARAGDRFDDDGVLRDPELAATLRDLLAALVDRVGAGRDAGRRVA